MEGGKLASTLALVITVGLLPAMQESSFFSQQFNREDQLASFK